MNTAASGDHGTITVKPVTPMIGAEIEGIDLSKPLTPAQVGDIHRALLDWKVLFFRDQPITDDQQLAFGRYFGKLTPAHTIALGLDHEPAIWERVAADYTKRYRSEDEKALLRPKRDYKGWHIDITFVANPNKYSILRGVEIPPYGGDTVWSNLEAAYNGLSPKIRELIDGLQAIHHAFPEDVLWQSERRRNTGRLTAMHPLVRVHPDTGRKHLFVNPQPMTHIVGLKKRESQALIYLLAEEITRAEYQVRFRWSPNALVIWDNQATAHAGPIDYAHFDMPRVVRRITVAGDLPRGPDGFVSRMLEGALFETLE